MRVLHVINSLNTGGAEKLIVDTLPLYNKKNIKSDLLLLKKSDSILFDVISKSNIEVMSIEAKSFYSFLNVMKIRKYLKNYDIVHAHLFPTGYWVSICKFLFFPKKCVIYTEHSTSNKRRNKAHMRWIERIIYSQYDKIICISRDTEKQLMFHLGQKFSNKLITIENGVNLLDFKPEYNGDLQKKGKIILTQIASFRYPKDQDTVIRSLKLLPENVIAQFVGSGPRIDECKKLVEELKLIDRVVFMGQRSDIASILAHTDICVLSSFYEGFGLAAVEGMASMKPIIASNVEGLNSIVKDYGLLFEKGDENQLANLILNLINNPEHYKNVSELCYKRSKYYDINIMVSRYIEVYNKQQ